MQLTPFTTSSSAHLQFAGETSSNGIIERPFTLRDIPGVLWTPAHSVGPAPLILSGHGGGLHKRTPGLVARAAGLVAGSGFAVAAIDAPGHGDRPRSDHDQAEVAAMFAARAAGDDIAPIVARYNASLAERAVPEWQQTLDALQRLPEIATGPVGYGGMTLASTIGIRLAAVEPRIGAAVFGGVFAEADLLEAARRITAPIEYLLSWDDAELPREDSFAMFDAFASTDKTLRAHPGGHHVVPAVEAENTARFYERHLRSQPVAGR